MNDQTEVDLLAVPERVTLIGGDFGFLQPIQQQDLVAGIDDRVDPLRQHRRAIGEHRGDKLRDRDQGVADQGGVDDFFR